MVGNVVQHFQTHEDLPVADRFKKEALIRLKERLDAGETPYEVTGIRDEHKFWRDKVITGIAPMSYRVYDRIMQCSLEDKYIVDGNSTVEKITGEGNKS